MRQIASIWLPHWPIERWQKTQHQLAPNSTKQVNPIVLTQTVNQTQKLYAVSLEAENLGLSAGMTLAEARAVSPTLQAFSANEQADAAALDLLARWCDRYSPMVAIDGIDGLLLDITGCGHLFGGEQALVSDLSKRLKRSGISAQIAVAGTVGAASALARYAPQIISSTETKAALNALNPLPVKALRLHTSSIVTLRRLGLKRIGDLLALPRPALARRFRGMPAKDITDLLTRLDQALGRKPEPITPLLPLPLWRLRHPFIEPVLHLSAIEAILPPLVHDLMHILQEAEVGVRRLTLSAFRVDGSVQNIRVGTNHPSRDAEHLARLFTEKLPALTCDFGFDLLMLSVTESERLPPSQIATVREVEAEATAKVLDRLSTRLGAGAVMQLKHRHSHIPERAQSYVPAYSEPLGWQAHPEHLAIRPSRLLMRPEMMDVIAEVPEGAPRQFRWRRVEHKVSKAEGPERIADEWWLATDTDSPERLTRDYYRIEVDDGARFWVFRRGLYAVPGVRPAEAMNNPLNAQGPCWFMHGFFA